MKHQHFLIIQIELSRRLDFEEQEQINSRNRQQHKREQTRQEASQNLDNSQPKRRVDIDTSSLTRNYLDRVYLNTIDKVQAKDDVNKEFERVEKTVEAEINQHMIILNRNMSRKETQVDHKHIRKQMRSFRRIRSLKHWLPSSTITCENIETNEVGKKTQKPTQVVVMR